MDGRTDEVRASIRRARRHQVFAWGSGIVGVLALYYFFSAGFFLYSVITILSLLAISTAIATINVLGLQVDRSVDRKQLNVGEETEVVLTVHNAKKLPALWLSWEENLSPGMNTEGPSSGIRTLKPGERFELRYQLRPEKRGLFRIGPAKIEGSGPFGLVRRISLDRSATFVTVPPKIVPINPDWPLGHRPALRAPQRRGLFDDPSRFIGVREYRAGDNLRRIHWRATARSGSLQTRVYEPSVLQGCHLAVDAHSGCAERLEINACAAASIADYILNAGQAVGMLSNGADAAELYASDWSDNTLRGNSGNTVNTMQTTSASGLTPAKATQAPVSIGPARGAWQREQLLDMLARLTTADHFGLGELLLAASPHLSRSLVVLVIASEISEELVRAVHSLKHSGFELAWVWTQERESARTEDILHLPDGMPVYPVAEEQDLQWLGVQSL